MAGVHQGTGEEKTKYSSDDSSTSAIHQQSTGKSRGYLRWTPDG